MPRAREGVAQLTMALSNEWADVPCVTVNAIAPGYIATENTAALQADRARFESILARIPAGRWGQPDDLKGCDHFSGLRGFQLCHRHNPDGGRRLDGSLTGANFNDIAAN